MRALPEIQKAIFNLSHSFTVNVVVTSSFLEATKLPFTEIITKLKGIKSWVFSDWKFPSIKTVSAVNGETNVINQEIISPGFDNHFIINSDDGEMIEEVAISCISLNQLIASEIDGNDVNTGFLKKKMSKNFRQSMPINHLQEDALSFLKEISHLANLHHSSGSILKSNIEWFSQAEHFHWMLHNNEDLIFKSPFKTNYDAYINYMNMLTDLKEQLA
ncbi:hypothetical protein [Chondrinema litorale]|uniref:hypothetical protein n=1 Tax=Chondrinema litorale TaxID=2994555 RepID=UPI00254392F9|nr:hypothetical protein [Chondrinema litorale]UZR94714.1 hypothetical protein OQ292_02640 [Chondrinema litorale]